MSTLHRSLEIRGDFDDGTGAFEAVAVTYGVVDSYGTVFEPGCFAESLEAHPPPIRWNHRAGVDLGRVVDFKDGPTELVIVGQLDSPDKSRWKDLVLRAWRGFKHKVLTDVSVGFMPERKREGPGGIPHYLKARLDEVSVVLDGAVPGAVLLDTRADGTPWGPVARRLQHAYLDSDGEAAISARRADEAAALREVNATLEAVRWSPGAGASP